jgi:hypothetical protein
LRKKREKIGQKKKNGTEEKACFFPVFHFSSQWRFYADLCLRFPVAAYESMQ